MICPRCGMAMIVMELDNIEIDHCFSCGGVWLDTGELEKLIKDYSSGMVWLTELIPAEESSEPRLKCPICQKEMEKLVWALEEPVTVDRCPEGHGVWLDNGELAAIIRQGASIDSQIASLFEEIFQKI
ncbi:MAG TPA: zf-TFIIB domain-containing protein [Bacillota bacterium]|nr:zf-TFIIB domain-containing protein [Bacillota bacterium]HPT88385.1 zf-TFIIB domain-containing protein [Bacillota bacterium]